MRNPQHAPTLAANPPKQSRTTFLAVVSALVATGLLACGAGEKGSPEPSAVGTLRMALGTTTNGHQYRLRQATFSISGPTSLVLDSETQPDADALTAVLNAGAYTVALADSWFLERLDLGGYVRVEASLVSPNPAAFTITTGGTTSVPFRFSTDGTIIVVGTTGTVSITTEVTEIVRDGGVAPDSGTGADAAAAVMGCPTPTRSCYGGPSGTLGVGACSAGTESCVGTTYGPCAAEILPAAETCNGVDDDCNGVTDDGC